MLKNFYGEDGWKTITINEIVFRPYQFSWPAPDNINPWAAASMAAAVHMGCVDGDIYIKDRYTGGMYITLRADNNGNLFLEQAFAFVPEEDIPVLTQALGWEIKKLTPPTERKKRFGITSTHVIWEVKGLPLTWNLTGT
jgi:hypothetical protein